MRVTLATWGSFGDLHPYLAVGLGLKARGHRVGIATCPLYREKVQAEGLDFHPLRPDLPRPEDARGMMERIMDARSGTRIVVRDLMVPALRETHADLEAACAGADLLIAHLLLFSAPLLSEKTGLPFLSTALQPMVFGSAYDPPVPPGIPWLIGKRPPPPAFVRAVRTVAQRQLRSWVGPVDDFRAEMGLKPGGHPLFDGAYSPRGTLALFSSVLATPQPDWPPRVTVTGFPFYDRLAGGEEPTLPPELAAFLDEGEPPILFTLGTSAVLTAGSFWDESLGAIRALGRRAVLLVGRHPGDQIPADRLPPGVIALPYAPFSLLMPRCAAIVHQGGIGTTGQALRAGKPQLVVPFAHDQPDHAARIARRNAGAFLLRPNYQRDRVAASLDALLRSETIRTTAARLGEIVRAEDGVAAACDAIERAYTP